MVSAIVNKAGLALAIWAGGAPGLRLDVAQHKVAVVAHQVEAFVRKLDEDLTRAAQKHDASEQNIQEIQKAERVLKRSFQDACTKAQHDMRKLRRQVERIPAGTQFFDPDINRNDDKEFLGGALDIAELQIKACKEDIKKLEINDSAWRMADVAVRSAFVKFLEANAKSEPTQYDLAKEELDEALDTDSRLRAEYLEARNIIDSKRATEAAAKLNIPRMAQGVITLGKVHADLSGTAQKTLGAIISKIKTKFQQDVQKALEAEGDYIQAQRGCAKASGKVKALEALSDSPRADPKKYKVWGEHLQARAGGAEQVRKVACEKKTQKRALRLPLPLPWGPGVLHLFDKSTGSVAERAAKVAKAVTKSLGKRGDQVTWK
jgi:hypothetical protein